MKKLITGFVGFTTVLSLVAFTFTLAPSAFATQQTQDWDTSGDYIVAMEYQGNDYLHDMTLNQDNDGNLTGNGGSPAGNNTYLWTITDGSVTEDAIEFMADYTATQDAVVPQTTLIVNGVIAEDGTMSGTWSDNYNGGDRSGIWSTTVGTASSTPTGSEESADQNNDGFIDTVEGIPFYGSIVESLTISGDTSPDSALDLARFPVANNQGLYLYERTFTLDEETDLDNIAVVIHSHDINGNGVYDGEKRSSVNSDFPFEASIPVACGVLEEQADGSYRANLTELNSSGATGFSTVNITDGQADVYNQVQGVTPNLAHAQHFHQGGDNTCPPNTAGVTMDNSTTVTVTIDKYINGTQATAITADNADFPMTSTWESDNMGAGTGSYSLSETNTVPYQAVTNEMTKGADYETNEVLTGNTVGASCTEGKPFALHGYTTGNTHEEAMTATSSMTMPTFTDMQEDKYVIVWNIDCSNPEGNTTEGDLNGDVVAGDGVLEVTSIEMVDTTATANGSFADGWEYVFHITVPTDEPKLAMKFANWMQTNGSGVIPVANNMRISSLQADNGGATILLTAENVYSTPDLNMVTDLDHTVDGIQVEVTVEVAVPTGTPNGAYTTSYGVRSNQ
ncbi:MAG: hypothetical protein WDZ88_00225 [Candidatus Paceibacterota bacterium]